MKRLLVLYTSAMAKEKRYAEGLIHFDGSVYVDGFYPEEGKPYGDLEALKNALRDNDGIRHWYILLLDVDKEHS
jgi:hypothetical protein